MEVHNNGTPLNDSEYARFKIQLRAFQKKKSTSEAKNKHETALIMAGNLQPVIITHLNWFITRHKVSCVILESFTCRRPSTRPYDKLSSENN